MGQKKKYNLIYFKEVNQDLYMLTVCLETFSRRWRFHHIKPVGQNRGDYNNIQLTHDNKTLCNHTHALFIASVFWLSKNRVPQRSTHSYIHPSLWAAAEIYDHIIVSLILAHKLCRNSEAITSTSVTLPLLLFTGLCSGVKAHIIIDMSISLHWNLLSIHSICTFSHFTMLVSRAGKQQGSSIRWAGLRYK